MSNIQPSPLPTAPIHILAFAASHRPDSLNHKLVLLAAEHLKAQGVSVDIARYSELDMPLYNDTQAHTPPDAALALAKRLERAQGVLIATPEYNWSFPGSLKNIIDWLSTLKPAPLAGKTALLLSATPGARGGIVGLQQLKSPLEALHMHVFHRVFPLPLAQHAFAPTGQLADSAQQAFLLTLLANYHVFTQQLTTHTS